MLRNRLVEIRKEFETILGEIENDENSAEKISEIQIAIRSIDAELKKSE